MTVPAKGKTAKAHTSEGSTFPTASQNAIPVLMLSLDRRIFEKDSDVRKRMISYGSIFSQLHIIVFSKRRHQLFESEKIAPNVWVYPTDSWLRWFYLFDVFSIVKRELVVSNELVVNIVSASEFEAGFIGVLLARKYKRRFQLQIHGDPWNPYSQKIFIFDILGRVAHYVLSRADCVRVVSEKVRAQVIKRYSRLSNRVSILPVLVDVKRLRNTEPSFDLHKRFPKFSFITLMVSRLYPEKNIFFALDVFAEIVRQYPKAGLIIVGDGPLVKRIRKYAIHLSISENVVLEGWQTDLVSYYKGANLFLHTALFEGYGMVLIEALACGVPIVTSDVGVASSLKGEEQ